MTKELAPSSQSPHLTAIARNSKTEKFPALDREIKSFPIRCSRYSCLTRRQFPCLFLSGISCRTAEDLLSKVIRLYLTMKIKLFVATTHSSTFPPRLFHSFSSTFRVSTVRLHLSPSSLIRFVFSAFFVRNWLHFDLSNYPDNSPQSLFLIVCFT